MLACALPGVDFNKANHLHVAQCLTSCHCSMNASCFHLPGVAFLLQRFLSACVSLLAILLLTGLCEIAEGSDDWYSWDQNGQASLAEVWNLESKIAACSEPRNSTVVFTKREDLGMLLPGLFSCAEMGLSCLSWNYTKAPQILFFAFSLNGKCTYFKRGQCAVQSQLKKWNLGNVALIYSQRTLRHPEVIYSKLLSVLFALHLPWAHSRSKFLFFSCHCVVSIFQWWK